MFNTPLNSLSILLMPLLLCMGCGSTSPGLVDPDLRRAVCQLSAGKVPASNRPRMTGW